MKRTPRELALAALEEHKLAEDIREVTFAQIWKTASEVRERPRVPGCSACLGRVGCVIDVGDLGEGKGRTFTAIRGLKGDILELKQYTTTIHREDLDTIPPMDAIAVFDRISKVEDYLTTRAPSSVPESEAGRRGHLLVSKHRRQLRHGAQLLRFFPTLPPLLSRDRKLRERLSGSYPAFLETHNDPALQIGEFRGGVVAVFPRGRRPFEIVLYFRPAMKGRLCQWGGNQRWGMAQAIREVTGALRLELCVRGQPLDYRWWIHAAPGEEAFVRIVPSALVRVSDPQERWAELFRSHVGLE